MLFLFGTTHFCHLALLSSISLALTKRRNRLAAYMQTKV